jgi:hypothetical protein
VILSTGMATLAEIEKMPGVLAFVFTDNDEPSRAKFRTAFASPKGKQTLFDQVIILHSTTGYPPKVDEINLRAIDTAGRGVRAPRHSDHSRCDSHWRAVLLTSRSIWPSQREHMKESSPASISEPGGRTTLARSRTQCRLVPS